MHTYDPMVFNFIRSNDQKGACLVGVVFFGIQKDSRNTHVTVSSHPKMGVTIDMFYLYQQTALGAPTIVDHHLHHHHLSGELLLEFVFQNKANEKCMYLKTGSSVR